MSAVARQLQSRNHDVVALSLPVSEPFARAANLPFVPYAEKEFPAEKLAETLGKNSKLTGEESQQVVLDAIAEVTEIKWRVLPRLLVSLGVDAVVLDECGAAEASMSLQGTSKVFEIFFSLARLWRARNRRSPAITSYTGFSALQALVLGDREVME
jgi:UDP:flavonoid glycosyltransferase YjiC (YdhE family)